MGDLGNEITQSLDRNGRGGMLAPLRLSDGDLATPGLAFISDVGTGWYRPGAGIVGIVSGGTEVGRFSADGLTMASGKTLTGDVVGDVVGDLAVFSTSVQSPLFRAGASGTASMQISGDPIQLTNSSGSVTLVGATWSPGVDGGVNLGSSSTYWGVGYLKALGVKNDDVGVGTAALVSITRNSADNNKGPILTFDNRGTDATVYDHRLGGIAWGSYRDVQDPSYVAGVYGVNRTYPGTQGAIDFVVPPTNGGSTDPHLSATSYSMRIMSDTVETAVRIVANGAVVPGECSIYAYAATNALLEDSAIRVNGYAGSNVTDYIGAFFVAPAPNEPEVYNYSQRVICMEIPGYPVFNTYWNVKQYNGYNGDVLRLKHDTGQYVFTVAIQNGSDERRKSNWAYAEADVVPALATVKAGAYDYAAGGVTHRSVGASAQDVRAIFPDAVDEDADGTLTLNTAGAAMAACVALAKRVMALEARLP
jgi:hypothetical protein